MEVKVNQPPPVVPPHVTYDLIGLTVEELGHIQHALYSSIEREPIKSDRNICYRLWDVIIRMEL